jgi:hypothetical protein
MSKIWIALEGSRGHDDQRACLPEPVVAAVFEMVKVHVAIVCLSSIVRGLLRFLAKLLYILASSSLFTLPTSSWWRLDVAGGVT